MEYQECTPSNGVPSMARHRSNSNSSNSNCSAGDTKEQRQVSLFIDRERFLLIQMNYNT